MRDCTGDLYSVICFGTVYLFLTSIEYQGLRNIVRGT